MLLAWELDGLQPAPAYIERYDTLLNAVCDGSGSDVEHGTAL